MNRNIQKCCCAEAQLLFQSPALNNKDTTLIRKLPNFYSCLYCKFFVSKYWSYIPENHTHREKKRSSYIIQNVQ